MRTRTHTMALVVAVVMATLTPAVASAAPASGTTTYTVQDGDALYGIAARSGVTIDSLLKANNLTLESIIVPGQKLAIPANGKLPVTVRATAPAVVRGTVVPAGAATTPAATAAPAPVAPPAGSTTYVVQAGDTIINLAFRFGLSPDVVLKANRLTISSVIVVGQKLAIPPGGQPVVTGNPRIDLVIAAARAQVGKPYKFGYDGPDYFDCSGLVRYAFARVGMALLHHTLLQKNSFPAVAIADIRPGDIVFFHQDFSHEGLYLGNNLMIQAPAPGQNVMISWVPTGIITGAVRPIV